MLAVGYADKQYGNREMALTCMPRLGTYTTVLGETILPKHVSFVCVGCHALKLRGLLL